MIDLHTNLKRASSEDAEDLVAMGKKKTSKKNAGSTTRKSPAVKKTAPAGPESGPILTPDMARNVLKADVARIVRKAKDKKPLTTAERALLEKMSEGNQAPAGDIAPFEVPSIAALCGVLGITRVTFYEWKKKFPNEIPRSSANGNYNIKKWQDFVAKKGLKGATLDGEDDERSEDLDDLKKRDLRAKAEEREFKLAILRREYFQKDDVHEAVSKLVAEALKTIRDKLENELPPVCAGLDAPRIRIENARVVDEICEILHKGPDLRDE